jgi:hypothetical protein
MMVAPVSTSSEMEIAAAPPPLLRESLTPPLEPTLSGARSSLGIESPVPLIICNVPELVMPRYWI